MGVAVKRVYVAASASDGVRVLVDRLWPRGLTKEDAAVKFWLRDLSPSDELRKWFHANPDSWRIFRKRYLKELANTGASAALEKLHDLAEGRRTVTLLYASEVPGEQQRHCSERIVGRNAQAPLQRGSSRGRTRPDSEGEEAVTLFQSFRAAPQLLCRPN